VTALPRKTARNSTGWTTKSGVRIVNGRFPRLRRPETAQQIARLFGSADDARGHSICLPKKLAI
jgi:hypothetical protein